MILRSLLFLPGNSPGLLGNADVLGADAVIFDLEDAVAPEEKDAARTLVRNAMPMLRRSGLLHVVRINAVHENGHWKRDLRAILPAEPDFVMPTKVSSAQALETVLAEMETMGSQARLIPLIETAMGIENALHIAQCPRVGAILLGAEDLSADLCCARTKEGQEIAYARARIVMAARASGILPIDTPFTDVLDDEGLTRDAQLARNLGFAGKATISPHHIARINDAFSPTASEIEYAREVLAAIEAARREGKGVVALHGKMIDKPIVSRAEQVLAQVGAIGGVYR